MGNPLDNILKKQHNGQDRKSGEKITAPHGLVRPRDTTACLPITRFGVLVESEPDVRDHPDYLDWDDCPDANEWLAESKWFADWNSAVFEAVRLRDKEAEEKMATIKKRRLAKAVRKANLSRQFIL